MVEMSRRGVLSAGAAAGVAASSETAAAVANPDLELLTSRSGVFTPARGESVMQFSFDFPEPSARVGDFLISFRVHTFENAYALDPARTRVVRTGSRVRISADGLLGSGGQEQAAGTLRADFSVDRSGVVQWSARADLPRPVKSIATILRGVPRGQLSISCNDFHDWADDEKVFEYPQLFGGMSTPLVILKTPDDRHIQFSARQSAVRPARFFFQPGPDGYRVELIHEHEGWARSNSVETCVWRAGPTADYATAAREHFAHVERTYALPQFTRRRDAPAWMRDIDLVMAIHGAHWTGYIFNDYAKSLETLRWTATQIEPSRVIAFLPAWDGRYYWNYPLYQPDPRMGGEEGLRTLISEARRMGFRVALMFGANAANRAWPEFSAMSDATSEHVDGDAFDLNWVDWDADRRNEGLTAFMNLGVPSWRRWLGARIAATIEQFGCDAYFLDILGAWENNAKADMHEGGRLLIEELRARHPDVAVIGEMLYDAQMAFTPMAQVARYALHPQGQDRYIRYFQHLSRPAPGRGSSGVHEAGFQTYDPVIAPTQRPIPTLTIVDDTMTAHREAVAAYIAQAKTHRRA